MYGEHEEGECKKVLVKELDEDLLSKLPLWFRRLRKAYAKRTEG